MIILVILIILLSLATLSANWRCRKALTTSSKASTISPKASIASSGLGSKFLGDEMPGDLGLIENV